MQLLIKTLRGKTIVIEVEPSNTILDIKNKITDREGIPTTIIRLSSSKIKQLEDDKTLEYYQIIDNSILEMKFKNRTDIRSFIDLSSGLNLDNALNNLNENKIIVYIINEEKGKFPIFVKLYDTIKNMKELIMLEQHISISGQALFINDILLDDNKTIKDYEIKNGSTIKLTINNEIKIFAHYKIEEIIPIKVKFLDSIKVTKTFINNFTNKTKTMFLFNNNELNENKTFKDYKIKEGDTVYLFDENEAKIKKRLNDLENLNISLKLKNKELEQKLNEMTKKNQELNKLINELRNNDLKEIQNKENLLEKEKNKFREVNQKFKEYQRIAENRNLNSKEILNLLKKLNEKEEEIEHIKSNLPFELKKGEKIMTLNFVSVDQKIRCSFICKNNDNFSRLENLLYNYYPEYRETNNYFLSKGNQVNRFKTLDENNINNNDIITLNIY